MTVLATGETPAEFDIIARYFDRQTQRLPGVVVGIGDDCALLELAADQQLAVSMDTLVAGVHFPAAAPADLVAERAVRVNLSDLAACGAEPRWMTLALTMPVCDTDWLQCFSDGLMRVASEFGVQLVGGDTTRGPLSITLQVHGSVPRGQALLRSGAMVGDRVFISGPLGDGAGALALLEQQSGSAEIDYLRQRYYRPQPQLALARLLRGVASAAIDVSDGLLADLGHICRRSGVGARLQWSRIPLSTAVRTHFSETRQRTFALAGGDDYQLCFCVPPERLASLQRQLATADIEVWEIGEIVAGADVQCWAGQQCILPEQAGYQHFTGVNGATHG